MISFDVTALAGELIMGKEGEPFAVRESITQRMIEAAVEIVNDPEKRDFVLDTLNWLMEDTYDVQTPDLTMEHFAKHIRTEQLKHGWDERIVVKVTFKKLGTKFHRAMVTMDLDATFQRNNDRRKKPRLNKSNVKELVSDNPSQEAMNEFLDLPSERPQRRTPVLSDRHARTVKDPTGRGW